MAWLLKRLKLEVVWRPAQRRRRQRGFTLVELIVVVIIITILAVIAIPSITQQLRDRRVRHAAQEVAAIYRNSRMHALGRGGAVLVRYDTSESPSGLLLVREGIQGEGTEGECAALPEPGCNRAWTDADSRSVRRFDIGKRGEFPDTHIVVTEGGDPVERMDICFTPLGRAFVRYGAEVVFSPLVDVPQAQVFRGASPADSVGPVRVVSLLPNGTARLAL